MPVDEPNPILSLGAPRFAIEEIEDELTRNAFLEMQSWADILMRELSLLEAAILDGSITTIKVAVDATSELSQKSDTPGSPVQLFDGSGTDNSSWVITDSHTYSNFGDNPVLVMGQQYLRVDQIRSGVEPAQAGPGAPHIFFRVIRYDTTDPPADSTINGTGDPVVDKFWVIFEPDQPISLSMTGFLPAAFMSQFDEPAKGAWKWEFQIKWEKFVYDVGTVTAAAAQPQVTGTGTKWKSFIEPGARDTVLSLNPISHVNLVVGAQTRTLRYARTQTNIQTLVNISPAFTNAAYTIVDPNVAPHVYKTFTYFNIFEVKR